MESISRQVFLLRSTIAVGLSVLFGCASTRQDWINAQVKDTLLTYNQFIAKHPKTPQADLAKKKILEMQAKQEWQNISSRGTIEDCRAFLAKHRNSVLVPEAKKKLEELEAEVAWQTAQKIDTADAYTNYLEKYPKSFNAGPAWQRIMGKDIESVTTPGPGSAALPGHGFQKTPKEKYVQVFRAPDGSVLHDWVVRAIESTGQEIVPGCIAFLQEKEGRFFATVNYASRALWSVGQSGTISPVGRRKAETAGIIRINYVSDGIEYDFYDTGPDKITWERLERKSSEGRSSLSKAITQDGRYYLKIN